MKNKNTNVNISINKDKTTKQVTKQIVNYNYNNIFREDFNMLVNEYEIRKQMCEIGQRVYNRGDRKSVV